MEEGGFARERDCDLIGEFEKGEERFKLDLFSRCVREFGIFF